MYKRESRIDDRDGCWQRISQRLEQHADLLRTRGTLTPKRLRRSTVYYVRFCEYRAGRRVQRSIYIGADPELVERARRLLAFYRRQSQGPQEAVAAARVLGRIVAALRRPDRRHRPPAMGRSELRSATHFLAPSPPHTGLGGPQYAPAKPPEINH
jgi:hypothetical protein